MERLRKVPDLLRKLINALEGSPTSNTLHLRGEGKITIEEMNHFLETGEIPPHLQKEAPPEKK